VTLFAAYTLEFVL